MRDVDATTTATAMTLTKTRRLLGYTARSSFQDSFFLFVAKRPPFCFLVVDATPHATTIMLFASALLLSGTASLLSPAPRPAFTADARAKLEGSRQWTNNIRRQIGRQLFTAAAEVREEFHRRPADVAVARPTQYHPATAPPEPEQATIDLVPAAPSSMIDSLEVLESMAPRASPPRMHAAWLAQYERTRELSVGTSVMTADDGSNVRKAAEPIRLAGDAKAAHNTRKVARSSAGPAMQASAALPTSWDTVSQVPPKRGAFVFERDAFVMSEAQGAWLSQAIARRC